MRKESYATPASRRQVTCTCRRYRKACERQSTREHGQFWRSGGQLVSNRNMQRVPKRVPTCPNWKRWPVELLEKNGSSGRTRTYNPPVNSCTNGKTDNYRQLRLTLKTRLLGRFEERLTTANFGGDSLKKSPKYFLPSPWVSTTGTGPDDTVTAKARRSPQNNNAPHRCDQHRHDANHSRLQGGNNG